MSNLTPSHRRRLLTVVLVSLILGTTLFVTHRQAQAAGSEQSLFAPLTQLAEQTKQNLAGWFRPARNAASPVAVVSAVFATVPVTGDSAVESNETIFVNLSPTTNAFMACPTQFTVNDLGDAADATPGDNLCATAGNVCTLRAAIEEANAITACSPLTINFSNGTINLASALPILNHPNLTISGPGASQLTVRRDTGGNYRIFTINSGRTVAISGLTIREGNSTQEVNSTWGRRHL